MDMILHFSVLILTVAAVLCDLKDGKIPNPIILAGLGCGVVDQVLRCGGKGILLYLGGIVIPVLMHGLLFYFRMIGAGDIKLLCVAGGFFGPEKSLWCVIYTLFSAGVISVLLLIRHRNLKERILYFIQYINQWNKTKTWHSYLEGTKENARFCFSAAILAGVVICICQS